MIYEIPLNIGGEDISLFLQNGFFDTSEVHSPRHRHRYGEIHILSRGELPFIINGSKFIQRANTALYIPPFVSHSCFAEKGEIKRTVFQTTFCMPEFSQRTLLPELCGEIISRAEGLNASGDEVLKGLLFAVCAGFTEKSAPLKRVDNRELLIYEYFVNNYNKNATLVELSREMCLSEKQTQRLVKKYTGNTFRGELMRLRLENAKIMIEDEGVSATEAAQRVGYTSYCGFWKALKEPENKANR